LLRKKEPGGAREIFVTRLRKRAKSQKRAAKSQTGARGARVGVWLVGVPFWLVGGAILAADVVFNPIELIWSETHGRFPYAVY
jgi:hypothetical protein